MKKFEKVNYDHLLASVLKPSRYINNEIFSRYNTPKEDKVNFCLAYPDVYEVGFSHLGIKILYSILNKLPNATADRAYAPWPDFGDLLKENNLPLFAVESQFAIKDFDVLGFTLQTELTYTNILYMLELSNISILQADRDENDPIVLGGGPCATNPEPLAIFFDAFLIGDGEEAIEEITNVLLEFKNSSRQEKLEKLAHIPGVYVPSLYKQENDIIKPISDAPAVITARKFMDFNNIERKYTDQLVPWLQPTHERYVAEIMRGCTRGCRFCHAGMFYRPFREQDPEPLLDQLLSEVKKVGWDEAALTSLSTSDYSCVKPVLVELYDKLKDTNSSLSLPSLRVDTIDDDISKLLNAMRQTGLTIAPEAGSQRLRNIINKNISEEEILKGVEVSLKNGWRLIKLYFMIGLPFEEESDIDAIIDLIKKIIGISGKKLQINVTISPFVPKSHTPFQWAALGERDDLIRKATKIKFAFSKQNFVKIKYHDVDSLKLEAIMSRGDRKIGELIYRSYKNGSIYDGWKEFFNSQYWDDAAKELCLDLEEYTKEKDLDAPLIWDHIDIKIKKQFLKKEWQNARAEATIQDCRDSICTGCGVCDDNIFNKKAKSYPMQKIEIPIKVIPDQIQSYYYRVYYQKMDRMRFVAHLDLLRMTHRFMRVAKVPLAYSQGYNPHPRISFGPPLPVGVEGEKEYFVFALTEERDIKDMKAVFQLVMPEQLKFQGIEKLDSKAERAMDYFNLDITAVEPTEEYLKNFEEFTPKFLEAKSWKFTKIRKRKEREVELKNIVHDIEFKNNRLLVKKAVIGASIFDILEHVYNIPRDETAKFRIIRKGFIRS